MRIFLMGFMGSGKSSIGKRLASLLGMEFIDLDQYIEAKFHFSIAHIFEQFGEEVFRTLEQRSLEDMFAKDQVVVATGGGTPCFSDNLGKLKHNGLTIYLKANVPTLSQRLLHSKINRPLIKGKEEHEIPGFVELLLEKRESFYQQADLVFETSNFNAGIIAEQIARQLIEGSDLFFPFQPTPSLN